MGRPRSVGKFGNINRPIAGPTFAKELPLGQHPLQLYSQGTPNGVKVTAMLEELLALGHEGAEYDAWLIPIGEGAQFGSGFVEPQSQLQDSSHAGSRNRASDLRKWINFNVSGRKIRRISSQGYRPACRDLELAILASRVCPVLGRRFWSFFTPMRQRNSNIPSIASQWRQNASSTCSTAT